MSMSRIRRLFSTPLRLTRRGLLYLALVLLVLVFVPLIVASSRWLHASRIDLTTDQLYTLTPGTLHIVDTLQRPLRLTLYFSDHATRDLPQLRSYEQRVREMLQEMVARSHGRIRLQTIDPVPYSDDEASAEGSGLTAANGGSNGERVFFGLAGSAMSGSVDGDGNDERVPEKTLSIAFFDPSRETFLEYDIAKLVYELNQTSKPQVGVISSLPVEGNPVLSEQPWTVLQQLGQLFDLKTIDPATLQKVDDKIRVLLLIHPKQLSPDAQYAIDQYVLGGGHLVVFVDPDAELDTSPYGPESITFPDRASDLSRLFKAWGVSYDPHKVVLDRTRALQIELAGNSLNHPAMLDLGAQELNRNDPVTASLQRINVSTAGFFDLAADAQTRLIPLLQSSAEAEVVSTQRVLDASNDPTTLLQNYHPDGTHYLLAARLQGTFDSAFPERAGVSGHRVRSAAHAEVILVADTDLLSDRLWVEPQTILGQTMMRIFANNGDLVTNLVDNLSGSSALLSIRGRSTSQRPFTRVQALRNVADQKFLQKEQELEQELADTRRRLDELQPAKGGHASTATAEQRREIEQFRQRQLAINKELRDVQHQLNAEIDALGLRVKVTNIVAIPALVVLFGLLYGWRRGRYGRRRR
ncbi:Gldg family protein [Rhodanobacter spathiphylli]|uniref:ABC transporter involved in gliding motility, auxiliary component n=1 Tax=Rhodanobacter spathiphylli B39 TaxID=1163407 RepID=I4W3V3_9GAMM|nr:Gldg family protein [Rhodanobacter spathiphylli]EIL94144.1 ABC transporter involved in gliding motility, auxiliary component [Rhodanobacter spathiphylli B39]